MITENNIKNKSRNYKIRIKGPDNRVLADPDAVVNTDRLRLLNGDAVEHQAVHGYDVQTSTNLSSTNWTTLYSLTLTNTPFPITDNQATNRFRFYRVKKN